MTISNTDNIILLKKSPSLQLLCTSLGFSSTLFSDDLLVITTDNKKSLMKEALQGKRNHKIVIYSPRSEETLRFAVEHTPIDLILGVEQIHPKDTVQYPRSGLDPILCKIAAEKGKMVGFSFSEVMNAKHPERLLARIKLNLTLCQKYKVPYLFSNFSISPEELRSKQDLQAFLKMLESNKTYR